VHVLGSESLPGENRFESWPGIRLLTGF